MAVWVGVPVPGSLQEKLPTAAAPQVADQAPMV